MKYMGSKHTLLNKGLGQLILEESRRADRIVDLFCGGSSISWWAAEKTELPVFATDLQQYAVVLARSILGRTMALDPGAVAEEWIDESLKIRELSRAWLAAQDLGCSGSALAEYVASSRRLCSRLRGSGPIWRSYGGYYFSPAQAATIDALLKAIPEHEPVHTVCKAAVIATASHCAASPGHTAQPFQPTPGASRYIAESWSKDAISLARAAIEEVCPRRANVCGEAIVGDAVPIAGTLSSSDLVVVDPPYSGVQYSRFYHVLEAIASRTEQAVTGAGRYPSLMARPQSSFSTPGRSKQAVKALLENLSRVRATVIFTFPAGPSSNGLSGDLVTEMANRLFDVEKRSVIGRFSTMGGNNSIRSARSASEELVLLMRSKGRSG